MASLRRITLDSCVWINYLTDGGDPATEPTHWLEHSARIVRHGLNRDFQIVVPTLVMSEIAGAGSVRGNHLPAPERARRINRVRDWMVAQSANFYVVELHERLAKHAAELAIQHQLTGSDGVILASAIASNSDTLLTWDDGLLKLGVVDGVRVTTPSHFGDFDDLLDEAPTE